jgi:hypothetical protein
VYITPIWSFAVCLQSLFRPACGVTKFLTCPHWSLNPSPAQPLPHLSVHAKILSPRQKPWAPQTRGCGRLHACCLALNPLDAKLDFTRRHQGIYILAHIVARLQGRPEILMVRLCSDNGRGRIHGGKAGSHRPLLFCQPPPFRFCLHPAIIPAMRCIYSDSCWFSVQA